MLRIKIVSKSENVKLSDGKYFGGFNGDKAIMVSHAEAKTFKFSSDFLQKVRNVKSKVNVTNCYISTK
jgi:hypothetical protein|tara:strand:+ start:724 stop:927 length:204 start_codon:yes stop_codon:yes gene_type:complete